MPFGPPQRHFANDAVRCAAARLWLALPTRCPPSPLQFVPASALPRRDQRRAEELTAESFRILASSRAVSDF